MKMDMGSKRPGSGDAHLARFAELRRLQHALPVEQVDAEWHAIGSGTHLLAIARGLTHKDAEAASGR